MPNSASKPPHPTTDTAASQAPHINTQRKQRPSDAEAASKLPHERDASIDMTAPQPDPVMQQAHRDLKKGLVDTDARAADGTPLSSRRPAR